MTAADRPSVTDNARAEEQSGYTVQQTAAHFARRVQRVSDRIRSTDYQRSVSDIVALDNVEGFLDRIARDDLDVFAAGRAETTTATTADITEALYEATQDPNDIEVPAVARRLHGLLASRDLLATARTRPTRQQLIDVLREHDPENYGGQDAAAWYYEAQADAVLALLADQPETTTEWGVRSEWTPTTDHFDHEHDARAFAARIEGRTLVRREVTAWTEVDR